MHEYTYTPSTHMHGWQAPAEHRRPYEYDDQSSALDDLRLRLRGVEPPFEPGSAATGVSRALGLSSDNGFGPDTPLRRFRFRAAPLTAWPLPTVGA